MFMMILGLIGAAFCVVAYWLIMIERLDVKGMAYSVLNLIGCILLLISISANFDTGDTGALLIEVCWIVISVYGIWKCLNGKKVDGGSVG